MLVGNFAVDVQHQQRVGHLFGALPPGMRNDTAFMDRIYAYLPSWDIPRGNRGLFTDHFGRMPDAFVHRLDRAAESEYWWKIYLKRAQGDGLRCGTLSVGGLGRAGPRPAERPGAAVDGARTQRRATPATPTGAVVDGSRRGGATPEAVSSGPRCLPHASSQRSKGLTRAG